MSDFNLTKASYLADFLVVPALLLVTLLTIANYAVAPLWAVPAAAAGYAVWTLAEYLTHRYLFHRVYRREHWLHHLRPRSNIGVPAWQSGALQVGLFVLSIGTFGSGIGGGLYLGFATGYLVYITVHHWIHRWVIPPGHWLRPAFDRHALHHGGVEANFNVLWPIWDKLCGTYADPQSGGV